MDYDVIIVGAGPAGSTTARECAARGMSVALLDRAEFPRVKPCAGGVTIRAANLLPFDLSPVVERVAFGMHFSYKRSNGFVRRASDRLALLTQRRHLDTFLVERAVDAGATLLQHAPIQEVEANGRHVVVQADGHRIKGRTLVAADGANGSTARLAGVDVKIARGIALEANVTPPGGVPAQWEDSMGFDMGYPQGGYGWLFPKGDHLNIGVGGWRYTGPGLRQALAQLVRFYGFDPADMWGVRGHHLPLRHPDSPVVQDNVALVGDAAGLIDPLTGDGIYGGISSGRLAARRLADYVDGRAPDLTGYQRDVERELAPDLSVSQKFHDLFHLSPALYVALERHTSLLTGTLCRLLRGEQTYDGIRLKLGAAWTAVEFASDLLRAWPLLQRRAGLKDPAPPERFFRGSRKRHQSAV